MINIAPDYRAESCVFVVVVSTKICRRLRNCCNRQMQNDCRMEAPGYWITTFEFQTVPPNPHKVYMWTTYYLLHSFFYPDYTLNMLIILLVQLYKIMHVGEWTNTMVLYSSCFQSDSSPSMTSHWWRTYKTGIAFNPMLTNWKTISMVCLDACVGTTSSPSPSPLLWSVLSRLIHLSLCATCGSHCHHHSSSASVKQTNREIDYA